MNNDASVIAKTNITPALCVAAADDRDAIDDRTVDNEQAAASSRCQSPRSFDVKG